VERQGHGGDAAQRHGRPSTLVRTFNVGIVVPDGTPAPRLAASGNGPEHWCRRGSLPSARRRAIGGVPVSLGQSHVKTNRLRGCEFGFRARILVIAHVGKDTAEGGGERLRIALLVEPAVVARKHHDVGAESLRDRQGCAVGERVL
jgi:hypothetical protein